MGTKEQWFELPLRALTSGSWFDNCIRSISLGFLEKKYQQIEVFTGMRRKKKTAFQSGLREIANNGFPEKVIR